MEFDSEDQVLSHITKYFVCKISDFAYRGQKGCTQKNILKFDWGIKLGLGPA